MEKKKVAPFSINKTVKPYEIINFPFNPISGILQGKFYYNLGPLENYMKNIYDYCNVFLAFIDTHCEKNDDGKRFFKLMSLSSYSNSFGKTIYNKFGKPCINELEKLGVVTSFKKKIHKTNHLCYKVNEDFLFVANALATVVERNEIENKLRLKNDNFKRFIKEYNDLDSPQGEIKDIIEFCGLKNSSKYYIRHFLSKIISTKCSVE